jgi:mannose-6-phosphate isomerase-like protein (cupin superfamily)
MKPQISSRATQEDLALDVSLLQVLCVHPPRPARSTSGPTRPMWEDEPMDEQEPRNIDAVLASVNDHWSPRTVAVVNDYDVRVVKVLGEFTRHSHPETDEFFLVLSGSLTIRMDGGEVRLSTGDTYVVPRGVVHEPFTAIETTLLLFEPSATVNTGDTPSPFTAKRTVV